MTSPPNAAALCRLAFWSKNMALIRDGKMEWPGFSYTDPEWVRIDALAASVSDGAYFKYVLINAVVFIAIAAAVMFGVFLPLASLLFPIPAETPAWKFAALLAIFCLLIIGIGLQISLAIAAAWSDDPVARAGRMAEPGDAALAGKFAWQINRITVIMCGLLVPGILIFITYDIQAGPLIAALKWLSIAAMGLSVAAGIKRRRGA